jgi:addiction module HigA family antidote
MTPQLSPIHPGEVLWAELLEPMNLTTEHLATAINVPSQWIIEIIQAKRNITADMALRLARYFDMSPQFWLGLQMDYDLDIAADKLADKLQQEVKPYALAA